ncbi:TPA: hypothetical protein I9Z33_001289 [Clostridium perfringens]|nr:hypothetical protein [Clostridium perfringens]HAT4095890.1 hypothetical protein [Clostridium perfringens]
MKRKLIALSLSISILSGTFFTLPIDKNVYANDLKNEGKYQDEIVLLDEEIYLDKEQLELFKQNALVEEKNSLSRSFSSDYNTYVQKSVSKSEAIQIISAYDKVTGMIDNLGFTIGGSTLVASISKSSRYRNAKNFITKYGSWGGNIILVTSFVAYKSIDKFKGEVQNAVYKMNSYDKLLFRVESVTNLQDSGMCRYKLVVQKR